MKSTPFHVDEVFEMAEQIERNGGDFYRRAADAVTDPDARAFLEGLAVLEIEHEQTFAELRKKVTGATTEPSYVDPEDQAVAYLRALVAGTVFDEEVWAIEPGDDDVAIMTKALRAEKDSIAFYCGLREMLTDPEDRGMVDEIIREEMRHVTMISAELVKRVSLSTAADRDA